VSDQLQGSAFLTLVKYPPYPPNRSQCGQKIFIEISVVIYQSPDGLKHLHLTCYFRQQDTTGFELQPIIFLVYGLNSHLHRG
jgi:hypothetical protein